MMMNRAAIDNTSLINGGSAFLSAGQAAFWTSTEFNEFYAKYQEIQGGATWNGFKSTSRHVRAARAANLLASWNCINGVCIDLGNGSGTYSSLGSCQSTCIIAPSWNCINNSCIDPGDGSGTYITLTACQTNCGANAINELTTTRELINIVDVLGKKINLKSFETKKILFFLYDDGTVEKKIIIE